MNCDTTLIVFLYLFWKNTIACVVSLPADQLSCGGHKHPSSPKRRSAAWRKQLNIVGSILLLADAFKNANRENAEMSQQTLRLLQALENKIISAPRKQMLCATPNTR